MVSRGLPAGDRGCRDSVGGARRDPGRLGRHSQRDTAPKVIGEQLTLLLGRELELRVGEGAAHFRLRADALRTACGGHGAGVSDPALGPLEGYDGSSFHAKTDSYLNDPPGAEAFRQLLRHIRRNCATHVEEVRRAPAATPARQLA